VLLEPSELHQLDEARVHRILRYLTAGLPDVAPESFWIVAMNPTRRPICRMRIRTGVLVACQCLVPDVFLALLLAEAKSFACLRIQPEGVARPNLADGRLLWNLKETAKLMNIEFVDYFIARSGSGTYYSWREHDRHAA
jgi:DNA repair protein RadC